MAYQKCPICVGTGYENLEKPCTVCKGKKIVCELTGEPPQGQDCNKSGVMEWPKILEEKDRVILEGKLIKHYSTIQRPSNFPWIKEYEDNFYKKNNKA